VARALVDAGYVTDAGVQAAADVLADALIVAAAEDVEATPMDHYSAQNDLIAEAVVWAAEDASAGDVELVDADKQIIDGPATQALDDQDTVIAAEAVIDAAFTGATASSLAAELIGEVDAGAVAEAIAVAWGDDNEE
jgi:hypothetical protein